jgi:hypothetical protein
MLCKSASPSVMESVPGYDSERLRRIRDKIRVVFGRESAMDDSLLSRRYTLTENGDLVMIV